MQDRLGPGNKVALCFLASLGPDKPVRMPQAFADVAVYARGAVVGVTTGLSSGIAVMAQNTRLVCMPFIKQQ